MDAPYAWTFSSGHHLPAQIYDRRLGAFRSVATATTIALAERIVTALNKGESGR